GYLLEFQFDTLKIDRMFLPNVDDPSSKKQHLISTAIELGKKLDMDVVVEGIETKEQLEFLVEQGCSFFQGFLLGRPMPKEAIAAQEEDVLKKA
ncbi:MAG: EAL domain-containing protein, partial [Sulfitobacter sp.]